MSYCAQCSGAAVALGGASCLPFGMDQLYDWTSYRLLMISSKANVFLTTGESQNEDLLFAKT